MCRSERVDELKQYVLERQSWECVVTSPGDMTSIYGAQTYPLTSKCQEDSYERSPGCTAVYGLELIQHWSQTPHSYMALSY